MSDESDEDFPECERCGGNFYYGDLRDGLCESCRYEIDEELRTEEN